MNLPVELQSTHEILRGLATRVKVLRLHRGWTQQELAERAGIALATYRSFERSGRISLERLLKIATVLDARAEFDRLFIPPPAQSLAELAARSNAPKRKRGRRHGA